MTDLSRLLHDALPHDPPPLDLPGVRARSHQLTLRRRVAAGGADALVLATAAVAVAAGAPERQRVDRLGPAVEPTAASATTAPGRVVQLHFTTGCGDISPVARRVEGPVLEASLRALFSGPTEAEKVGGTTSTFGPDTSGLLLSVRTKDGTAYVDLNGSLRDQVSRIMDVTKDSAPCSNFGEQVGGTLRQFGGIGAVYYAYDGDPADFVTSVGGTCPVPPVPGGRCDAKPFRSAAVPSPDAAEQQPIKAAPASRISQTDEFGLLTVVPGADIPTLDVDRVDMLGGAEAEAAARARGDQVSNDYYLVNDNPDLHRYRISPQAVVWGSIQLAGTVEHRQLTVQDLLAFLQTPAASSTLFHLDLQDGVVIAAEEQYRP